MEVNAKNTEDEAVNCIFAFVFTAFSAICKINEASWYILLVEVTWGKFLAWFMGFSDIE